MKSTQLPQKNTVPLLTYSVIISCLLAVIVLTFLFYVPSLKYGFYFDDKAQLLKYFKVRTNTFWNLFFVGPRWVVFWLNALLYTFFKHNTLPYRLFNICLHIATGSIIFSFLNIGLKNLKSPTNAFFVRHSFLIALLTAGLFLLHPVQTQTITYVVQGQLEGLAGFCLMSMALMFLIVCTSRYWLMQRGALYVLFIIAFFSCGTKEIAIVGPLLLLVVDWFFVAQGQIQSIKKRLWIHGILIGIVGGLYLYILKPAFFKQVFSLAVVPHTNPGNVLQQSSTESLSTWLFACSQWKVILHYISIFFYPFGLSVDYDWKLVPAFFCYECLLPLILLLMLAFGAYRMWQKSPQNITLFAIFWFCIAIAPRSSIIPSPELLADYKTYIASFGILFLIASLIIKVLDTYIKRVGLHIGCIFLLLTICGVLTYKRNMVWRTALDFWHAIVITSPQKARSHNNYGIALCEAGRYQEAIDAFNKAIELDAHYANPYINLSIAYAELGDTDKEIENLAKALAIDPTLYELYNNLATAFISKKEYQQAEKAFAYALAINPYYGKALYNKGMMYMQQHKLPEAWEVFKQCCTQADFDNAKGFEAYAKVSMMLEKYQDAYSACKSLLLIDPHHAYAQQMMHRLSVII